MSLPPIYLDHNATTPIAEEVLLAMTEAARRYSGNPSSQHAAGRAARAVLEDAREEIAAILGARWNDTVLFTSGGTEANNLALFGLAGEAPSRVLISAIEHPSVDAAAMQLKSRGWDIAKVPVEHSGLLRQDALSELLQTPTRLASVIYGNNETGVLQPIDQITAACHNAGAAIHIDAVQVAGKLPLNFAQLDVEAMTVTPHKFHGPKGIGALILRSGVRLAPQIFGGQQQDAQRPGTESVALAVGFCEALRLWRENAADIAARLSRLRETFEQELQRETMNIGTMNIVVHSSAVPRLPHTSNIAFPGVDRQELLLALDNAGVACSAGSACASGSSDPSPTLAAMGVPEDQISASLRFSFGRGQQPEDVVEAARRISKCVNNLRGSKPA